MQTDIINLQLIGCLEDTIDKLEISGQIMPLTTEMRSNTREILEETINEIKNTQAEMEGKFLGYNNSDSIKNLKAATHGVNRAFNQNPLSRDTFEKIEVERLFLQRMLENVVQDQRDNSLDSLRQVVKREKGNKTEFQQIIKREEETRKVIGDLKKSLLDVKQDKEVEIQKRNELIAHLKDKLQELKAKTNMEAKYVKKSTDNSVSQTKKKCDLSETDLKANIEKLQEQIDEENRCNAEMESFLKTAIAKMKQLTDYWTERSDRETLQKQVDLDNLKNGRAKDLEKYQNLARTFAEYEKVVLEDRFEKDKERRKQEQEKFELEATIKIQAWWRSQMMRHKLGAAGKKKKKGKKGKKGKK
ncbi:IQ domain-containing G [Brachionus plicatilis]|uniref:IQ domain-containing G n=1 Tax=Brachionus plicatilis TaxID=10195 RepID=A0A3M7RPK1_BRAPC|nr:IQ domain-containing G [Brachionus plicatilis]